MRIVSHFTNAGVPATGLSATIRIRRADTGELIVTDLAMTEVGDGGYSYDFAGFDPSLDYSIRVDGSAILPDSERYQFAGNEAPSESAIADAVLEEALADHDSTSGSLAEAVSFVQDIEGGKQEITTDGGGLLKTYKADNTTPVANFELYDEDGDRTTDVGQISRRERV